MKTLFSMVVIAVLAMVEPISLTSAADPMSEPGSLGSRMAPHMVTGVLLKIEGEVYLLKDDLGGEVRLRVDKQTTMVGDIKPGNRVEALVSEDGRATTMKQLRG